ncbi:cytidine deaminase [candidate division TA06 bacterium]|nr:cytidine deaminase [candidate division TA06 bacterium]
MDWTELLEAAEAVRERAYCPYSGFQVGSAILTEDGKVFIGCNVENRTFGLTVCAERVAVLSAVAEGHRKLAALVAITDTAPPSPPCGQCLEVMTEFGHPDLPVLLANIQGESKEYRLRDLLPHPFEFPLATDR